MTDSKREQTPFDTWWSEQTRFVANKSVVMTSGAAWKDTHLGQSVP